MNSREVLDAIYFTGPFGGTGSALHSAVPPAVLLAVYWMARLGGVDRRRILLWFLIGWLGHALADFLTHAGDTRPLFWPITDWQWSSPVSYYNPGYYGREFFFTSHALILLTMAALLIRRIQGRKKARRIVPSTAGIGHHSSVVYEVMGFLRRQLFCVR